MELLYARHNMFVEDMRSAHFEQMEKIKLQRQKEKAKFKCALKNKVDRVKKDEHSKIINFLQKEMHSVDPQYPEVKNRFIQCLAEQRQV